MDAWTYALVRPERECLRVRPPKIGCQCCHRSVTHRVLCILYLAVIPNFDKNGKSTFISEFVLDGLPSCLAVIAALLQIIRIECDFKFG